MRWPWGGNQAINVTFAAATVEGQTGFRNGNPGPEVAANYGTAISSGASIAAITAVPEPTSIVLVSLIGGLAGGARLRSRYTKKLKSEV